MIDIEPGRRGDGQQPGSAPGLASRTTGYRQVSEIEEITEEARPGVQQASARQCGCAPFPGGDAGEPVIQVRVESPEGAC